MREGDLFGHEPAIAWDEQGRRGEARDGRPIVVDVSVLSGCFVATIPLDKRWRDCVTRRACATADEARRAAEAIAAETMA